MTATQQLDLFSQPKVRHNDPATSRDAATAVSKGSADLETAIVDAVDRYGPCTDEEIVDLIHAGHGERWKESTIVSARARCVGHGRLVDSGDTGLNRRNRAMTVWRQP